MGKVKTCFSNLSICLYSLNFWRDLFLCELLLITLIFLFLLHTEAKGGEGEEILKKTLETEGMINLSGSCYTASFMKPYEFSNNVRVFWKKPNRIRMEYFAGDTLRLIFITT